MASIYGVYLLASILAKIFGEYHLLASIFGEYISGWGIVLWRHGVCRSLIPSMFPSAEQYGGAGTF